MSQRAKDGGVTAAPKTVGIAQKTKDVMIDTKGDVHTPKRQKDMDS